MLTGGATRSSCRGDHKKKKKKHIGAVIKQIKTLYSHSFSLTILLEPLLHIVDLTAGSEEGVRMNLRSLKISALLHF